MSQSSGATWEAWLTAYEQVHVGLPGTVAEVACPHCDRATLRIAFMGSVDQARGVGFFWCDSCLFGIGLSRAVIPAGIQPLPFGLGEDELKGHIPNYVLIPPHFV